MLQVYHYTGDDAQTNVLTNAWQAQTFKTAAAFTVNGVALKMWKAGTPGTVTVGLRTLDGDTVNSKPTGDDLTSGTFDANILPEAAADAEWVYIPLTEYALSGTTRYAVVVHNSPANTLYLRTDTDSGYADGGNTSSADGETWGAVSGAVDVMFAVYGTGGTTSYADQYTNKYLVVAANDEVWYESIPGLMSELAAANGDIDTSEILTMIDAYGKVFIANGGNLKVADFINTKITTTDLNAHAPDFGTILTGGTSGAKMIVDYITSTTADAACTIYGKRTTTATFANAETVTGKDDDDNDITFVLSAAETAPPHWYDWTVFGNDTAFGVMPEQANLVSRYRGRLVLSGNKHYPNQWYMSKVGNPWNWMYASTDPLTAVAGNNSDAGIVGDTVKAVIPFSDDYLIFGCSGSIHLLDGDPAFGGSIDQKDDHTGIFSSSSWCKDNANNLYFMGTDGIYVMEQGRTPPVNISRGALPNFIADLAANTQLHRVTLAYDPKEHGIFVFKTAVIDGENSCYFYSLRTQGWYPLSLPNSNGVFGAYYYESSSGGYSGLLLGCYDGYIREFLRTAKCDDSGASDTAISSYMTLAPFPIGDGGDAEGKISQIVFESAGGASGGDFSDADGFSYAVHVADDAETCIEDVKDGATANLSGTISGTGRKSRIRQHMRGMYGTIKISNSTISTAFAINRILVDKNIVGRFK